MDEFMDGQWTDNEMDEQTDKQIFKHINKE